MEDNTLLTQLIDDEILTQLILTQLIDDEKLMMKFSLVACRKDVRKFH